MIALNCLKDSNSFFNDVFVRLVILTHLQIILTKYHPIIFYRKNSKRIFCNEFKYFNPSLNNATPLTVIFVHQPRLIFISCKSSRCFRPSTNSLTPSSVICWQLKINVTMSLSLWYSYSLKISLTFCNERRCLKPSLIDRRPSLVIWVHLNKINLMKLSRWLPWEVNIDIA